MLPTDKCLCVKCELCVKCLVKDMPYIKPSVTVRYFNREQCSSWYITSFMPHPDDNSTSAHGAAHWLRLPPPHTDRDSAAPESPPPHRKCAQVPSTSAQGTRT